MTTIKPPTGAPTSPHLLDPASDQAGATPIQGDRAAGASFADALAQASRAQGQAPVAGAGGTSGDPIGALAKDVEQGRLTIDQAVTQLIERATASVGPRLSPADKADLAQVLRSALESDPMLGSLQEER